MHEGYLTVQEACKAYGVSVDTLRKRRQRGQVKAVHSGKEWLFEPMVPLGDYKALVTQWLKEQANGYHTGKPMGQHGIEANRTGLLNVWRYLKQEPSIQALTAQALRLSLSSVPIDYQKRTCHYSIREQMYKGACSFTKLLIREGLKTEADLLEMRKQKPKRVFPPKRKVVKEDQLARLLDWLEVRGNGRTDFDIAMSRTIIALMAYAGLRRADVLKLERGHVNLKHREIIIVDGKGHKQRMIGMTSALYMHLQRWALARPKINTPHLLIQPDGSPITESVIAGRFKRLAKSTGIDFSAHALRRAFATIHADKGVPLSHLQEQLGHSKIETTMGYVMTDQRVAMESLKRL